MKTTIFKQLFFICIAILVFSCNKDEDNYTAEEATVLEEGDSKKLIDGYIVRVKAFDIEGKEANFLTFKSLNIKAVDINNPELVYEPRGRTFFNLPAGTYTFYSDKQCEELCIGLTKVYIENFTILGSDVRQSVFLKYGFQYI